VYYVQFDLGLTIKTVRWVGRIRMQANVRWGYEGYIEEKYGIPFGLCGSGDERGRD